MLKYLLGVLLLPALANAEPVTVEKPVICDKVKTVIEFLSGGNFKEQPFWVGSDDTSKYVMMVNEKTGTWTMVQFNDQIACIIGTGENHRVILKGTTTKSKTL